MPLPRVCQVAACVTSRNCSTIFNPFLTRDPCHYTHGIKASLSAIAVVCGSFFSQPHSELEFTTIAGCAAEQLWWPLARTRRRTLQITRLLRLVQVCSMSLHPTCSIQQIDSGSVNHSHHHDIVLRLSYCNAGAWRLEVGMWVGPVGGSADDGHCQWPGRPP